MILVFKKKLRALNTTRFILSICLLITTTVGAQDYNHAVKVSTSNGFGIAYKHLTDFEKGFEISLMSNENLIQASAIRIHQQPAFPLLSDKVFALYGYGTHLAYHNNYTLWNPFDPNNSSKKINRKFIAPGIDAYAGLEYRFLKIPFTIVLDLNCNFEFFRPGYFAINIIPTAGVAYVF